MIKFITFWLLAATIQCLRGQPSSAVRGQGQDVSSRDRVASQRASDEAVSLGRSVVGKKRSLLTLHRLHVNMTCHVVDDVIIVSEFECQKQATAQRQEGAVDPKQNRNRSTRTRKGESVSNSMDAWLSSNVVEYLMFVFLFQDEAVDAAIKAKCKRLHNFTSVRIVERDVTCLVLFVPFSNQHQSSWKPQEGTRRKKRRNQGRSCFLFDYTQPGL